MSVVTCPLLTKKSFYLPHHAVMKPNSTTTKLRVVFNASAPSSNGASLNDVLHQGPTLQTDLTMLILRWRFFQYVFCADIEKMYRQILVNPLHTPFQRILFRTSALCPVQDFELNTVTFGVKCAPYLAIRTLRQLADDEKERFPLASHILRTSTYVDDVLYGGHDILSALQSRNQLINALKSAGFHLRKWASNDQRILHDLAPEYLLNHDFLTLEDKSNAKMLGVKWNALTDSFSFETHTSASISTFTKREVLRCIAKLFDPAGWLAPVIIEAKIIMQQVWLDEIGWDEELTPETGRRWNLFLSTFSTINTISIPRWVKFSPDAKVEFHAFCDASEKAYAACLYLRVVEPSNKVSTSLLLSKTKVAPVKPVSLPRLELCGALLLAEMVKYFLTHVDHNSYSVHFWTDSTIVLYWLRKHPSSLKTFEANRVAKIWDAVGNQNWKHVQSTSNPADLGTRGCTPLELRESSLWWYGPSWLTEEKSNWPVSHIDLNTTVPPGLKTTVYVATSLIQEDFLARFSSFSRALRISVHIFRFRFRPKRFQTVTPFRRAEPKKFSS